MANNDAAFGLRLEQTTTGNSKTQRVYFDADDGTAVFIGDALSLDQTNGGSADGVPAMVQAAAGGVVSGVLLGIEATDSATSDTKYRLASTAKYGIALVTGIKDMIFEVQEDSDGGALTADDVGKMCDLIVGSGDTTSGRSGMEIDSSSASTSDGQVTLIEPVQRPGNAIGTNCIWRVQINEAAFR
jgi:hypothetical protein